MRFLPLLPLLLTACPPTGKTDGTDGATDDTAAAGPRTFEDFVNVTTPWVGQTDECIEGQNQVVDPSCQVDITVHGTVVDFQTGDSVPDATVEYWSSDDVTTSTFDTLTADADGNFDLPTMSCTPIGYGTLTPPEWEATKDTYEVHQTFGYSADGGSDEDFNSVSEATSRLIPSLIGVDWDQTTGIIAGTAYDCNTEPIQYAQIYLHDSAGNPPATGDVYYFSANGDTNLPTDKESQPYTNTNGLWVAINVPAGAWTVEMWGYDPDAEGSYVMLGATELQINAGSVVVSNIYTGITDGIWYPGSCLAACGG
jgi:hypothetical protein